MKLPALLTALAERAETAPDRIAIISDDLNWTYAQLWSQVLRMQQAVDALALPLAVPVAVTAHKSVATIALLLALGSRGHTPLSVSADLGPAVKPQLYASAGIYCELTALADEPDTHLSTAFLSESAADMARSAADMRCPLMLTTSGSTGVPKIVSLATDGVYAFFSWAALYFDLDEQARVLSYAPLNFDLSLLEVWAPLARGATVIFTHPDKATQSSYLQDLIRSTQPHLIQAVPMFYTLLCKGIDERQAPQLKTQHIIFTGDVTPQALRQQVAALFPQAKFHNVYGCTETNDSFVFTASASEIIAPERLPLGVPIQGSAYQILDDAGERIEGAGEGLLHTSTPFMSHGYSDANKTASVFYWDESAQRRYYHTGDRVSRGEDGTLTLLGRSDHIVKVRGVRTNLQDIEQVIGQAEWVQEGVVVAVQDAVAGVSLHAVIVPKDGQRFDGLSLRILCARHLPLTAVPKRFHLCEIPLPRTSTAKPDRKKLEQIIQAMEI